MNTVAIVKVVWIATVFATAALVSESLVQSRTGPQIMVGEGEGSPTDAGTEPPRGYAAARGEAVVASAWDLAL